MEYTLWNLKEAAAALASVIHDLEDGNIEGFATGADLAHVYHHLNTAWSARGANTEAADACSDADFHRWRRFPEAVPDNFTGTA